MLGESRRPPADESGGPVLVLDRLQLVGARGFEPPTTCTPYRCATKLRYAPIWPNDTRNGAAGPVRRVEGSPHVWVTATRSRGVNRR